MGAAKLLLQQSGPIKMDCNISLMNGSTVLDGIQEIEHRVGFFNLDKDRVILTELNEVDELLVTKGIIDGRWDNSSLSGLWNGYILAA